MIGGTLVGPSLHALRTFPDPDGRLTVGEFTDELPFVPQRLFLVSHVPPGARRACHAQRTGAQLLAAAHGRFTVVCATGATTRTFELDDPSRALYVPAGNWIECRDFGSDAVMLVLASDTYDPDDQIEDFDDYLRYVEGRLVGEVALTP